MVILGLCGSMGPKHGLDPLDYIKISCLKFENETDKGAPLPQGAPLPHVA